MSSAAEVSLENRRVMGIYAHIDAGKTTTSEAILYTTGRIHRLGSVDAGDTQLDWMEQERARGITISAAATTCYWRGCRISLIDTPGHIDFTAEVVRSIRVIDGAVIVLCGVGGVETQTETVWRHIERQNLPRLLFVNKLDRASANFFQALGGIRQRLSTRAVALQLPLGAAGQLRGVVDLLEQQALYWQTEAGEPLEEPRVGPLPPEMQEPTAAARAALVDAICDTDEALLARRIEGHSPSPQELRAALRRAARCAQLTPVLCGSARQRIGIQPLLDAIAAYLPAPPDRPAVVGIRPEIGAQPQAESTETRPPDPAAPLCATAFKIVSDPHVDQLAWTRLFSGHLEVGDAVYNPRSGQQERIGRIYRLHANRREHLAQVQAGDVVALVGARSAITGDTLCDPAHPIMLEAFQFPEPVIALALAPQLDEERDRLHQSVARLCAEDPTLRSSFDAETGELVLAGMGELHLEITVDRLRSEYGLLALVSPFRVAYRETIRRKAEASGVYRKQTGGHGHFAIVRLRVEPLPRGEGVTFINAAPAAELTPGFAQAVEAGARQALAKGILAGYPTTDLRLTLLSGRFHEVDSNAMDFRIAGSLALRQAVLQAAPTLLEPVMQADINVDEEHLGPILGDFGRRRGAVSEVHLNGKQRSIVGEVPLVEMLAYATAVRDLTHGRGSFTLEFKRYELVPERLVDEIVARRQQEGKVVRRY